MSRVPPSEKTKQQIERLLREGTPATEDPKSALVQLGVRRLVEEALEAAVRDLLGGRGYYQRRAGEAKGYRNGYRQGRLKTSEGEVSYATPQVRQVEASSLGPVRELLSGRTEGLERLALEMFARGCSTRDIEDLFARPEGGSLLSRTAVSEISEALWDEYEEFATRELSDIKPLYLFLDGIAERLHAGSKAEAVLCAWAITWSGRKVLIQLAPGTKESTDCCRQFLQDLKRRGLSDPVLVITDGAAGLIRAVEECFPNSLRQRCLAHKMRNLLSKVPADAYEEFKQAAEAAYHAPSPTMAQALREDLVGQFEQRYPTAVRCFEEDFEACIAHLHCPAAHHRSIRTTNLLERLFVEERRRTRAVGTLLGGERPILKLMYAALLRASERWQGFVIQPFTRGQLERLAEQLQHNSQQTHAPAGTITQPSTPTRVYSRKGT